jgi:hypothetical protein
VIHGSCLVCAELAIKRIVRSFNGNTACFLAAAQRHHQSRFAPRNQCAPKSPRGKSTRTTRPGTRSHTTCQGIPLVEHRAAGAAPPPRALPRVRGRPGVAPGAHPSGSTPKCGDKRGPVELQRLTASRSEGFVGLRGAGLLARPGVGRRPPALLARRPFTPPTTREKAKGGLVLTQTRVDSGNVPRDAAAVRGYSARRLRPPALSEVLP